jgi:N6-L-threonylcarbamoyladenine synthase
MIILGIETSCDETAAALVDEQGEVFSDIVHSQVSLHGPYGGVIPELAARDHIKNVLPVVQQALEQAGKSLETIDGIAVTVRPGLAGALLVGTQMAKTLAWTRSLPIVGVDHLVGHLLAVFLQRTPGEQPKVPIFPYVALLASGGHTALYHVAGWQMDQIQELGGTRDDAAGEAFDKAAKMLQLGYPGGPIIDRLAALGNPMALELPMPMMQASSLEFSFSGIKTFLARHLATNGLPKDEQSLADTCASFQRTVVEVLAQKTVRAAKKQRVQHVVLAGGVAANQGLRRRCQELCDHAGLTLAVPPVKSCTDNAAMIAYAGALRLAAGERDNALSLLTSTSTGLMRATRKGRGKRTRQEKVAQKNS